MPCNEEYLCFRQANSAEATSECLIVFNIWNTSSFWWCMVPFCNPSDCFQYLWQPRWKSKSINVKNYCIYSNKRPRGAAIHKSWKRDRIWANIQNVQCPKAIFGGIWPPFYHKKWEGRLLERGTFIEINTVGNKSVLIQPSSIIIISCISKLTCFNIIY